MYVCCLLNAMCAVTGTKKVSVIEILYKLLLVIVTFNVVLRCFIRLSAF